jgi:hypothetical protein
MDTEMNENESDKIIGQDPAPLRAAKNPDGSKHGLPGNVCLMTNSRKTTPRLEQCGHNQTLGHCKNIAWSLCRFLAESAVDEAKFTKTKGKNKVE